MHTVSTKQALLFICRMVRSFPVAITVMFALSVVWAISISVTPYLIKVILNRVAELPAGENLFTYLMVPVAIYIALELLMQSMYRLGDYFRGIKMFPNLRRRISSSIFDQLLGHSHHYYQNNFAGSLANKVSDLAMNIPEIVELAIQNLFGHSLALFIAVYTLWLVNVKFALVLVIWAIAFLVVSLFFAKRLASLANIWSSVGSSVVGKIVDALGNMLSVRLFARQAKERTFLNVTLAESVRAEQNLDWTFFYIWVFYGYSFVLMQGVSLYFLIQGRQQGIISIGDFALILTLNNAIAEFLWRFAQDLADFAKKIGRVTQALEVTTEPYELVDAPEAQDLIVHKGQIAFEGVHFQYKGTEALFDQLSVSIEPGQKVGLVGYSGGGKTTFVHLILRLFEVTGGRILIDGQDIRAVTQKSLRQAIGMIPQDPSLFHRTLMDNIRYGREEASDEEVMEAAKRAHAHEFIAALSDGYQSLVGERGVKLSGGQRQRIA
ncbi:MAG: ABC transporter ATP-binding protein, partial [Alphaproteobacteria bacterium]